MNCKRLSASYQNKKGLTDINDLPMWSATFSKSKGFFLMQLLENMTDVIRKGILEAEVQLQKASEEKLMEEVTCICLLIL